MTEICNIGAILNMENEPSAREGKHDLNTNS